MLPESRGLSSKPRRYRFSGHSSICMHASARKYRSSSGQLGQVRRNVVVKGVSHAVAIGKCRRRPFCSRPYELPACEMEMRPALSRGRAGDVLDLDLQMFGGVRGSRQRHGAQPH